MAETQRRELPKEKCPRCSRENVITESPNVLGVGKQWMFCSKCKWLISRNAEGERWKVIVDTPYPRDKTSKYIGQAVDGL